MRAHDLAVILLRVLGLGMMLAALANTPNLLVLSLGDHGIDGLMRALMFITPILFVIIGAVLMTVAERLAWSLLPGENQTDAPARLSISAREFEAVALGVAGVLLIILAIPDLMRTLVFLAELNRRAPGAIDTDIGVQYRLELFGALVRLGGGISLVFGRERLAGWYRKWRREREEQPL